MVFDNVILELFGMFAGLTAAVTVFGLIGSLIRMCFERSS